jgi:hypothetical protein
MPIKPKLLASVLWPILLTGLAACSPPRPPSGDKLRLHGHKGAICLADRECASNRCLAGRCTEKIDKVGLGGECLGNDYCKDGFFCDLRAKKCSPKLKCEDFQARLTECINDVYLKFRPQQQGKLRRMSARARKRFLERIKNILYRGLCRATSGSSGLPYARAVKLLKAAKQSSCTEFATGFHGAMGKTG